MLLRQLRSLQKPFNAADIDQPTLQAVQHVVQDILDGSVPNNECYPQVVCSTIISRLVSLLNARSDQTNPQEYMFLMKPKLTENMDGRTDKRSDLSLLKVVNCRTFILIELKLTVGEIFTGDIINLDNFAQLLLEGIYAFEEDREKYQTRYRQLLLVLSNGYVWHIFLVDMESWAANKRNPLPIIQFDTIYHSKVPVQQVISTLLTMVDLVL